MKVNDMLQMLYYQYVQCTGNEYIYYKIYPFFILYLFINSFDFHLFI